MTNDVAVRIEGVWKRYGLGITQAMREIWNSALRSRSELDEDDVPWALRDISFELKKGEALGIIGPNGAGKSTLLKILAGVTPATRGTVNVNGTVFPMIELNAGLHLELTGRENVYMLGAIMGLSRSYIRSTMPQIEEFCDLGDYFDQPVRTYSSGMLARLGFGVAVNVEAEILLIDEVLAVGDFSFQNKCLAHFQRLRKKQTLLFVTHNLAFLPYVCGRAIYLEKGKVRAEGNSQEVILKYEQDSLRRPATQSANAELQMGISRDSSGHVDIFSMRVTDWDGHPLSEVERNQGFCLEVQGFCHTVVGAPLFSFAIRDPMGVLCWRNLSAEDGYSFGPLQGHFRIRAKVPPLPLRGGRYTVVFTLRDENGYVSYERLRSPILLIKGHKRVHGVLSAQSEWELTRGNIVNS